MSEDQIYRIDHYLGKETVQNLLVFRFANGIFEPIWNHKYIDHVEISVCESIGVGSRAGYFDKAGITRDIVQNHALQLLCLVALEPPVAFEADAVRDEKVKVLRSIQRYSEKNVVDHVVRAHYLSGSVAGENVKGYLEEDGVDAYSSTETYVAMELFLDNWRWANVPFYLRAGKRLAKRVTEISIHFKNVPHRLFQDQDLSSLRPNILSFQIQPDEGIALKISSKPPGPKMRVQTVNMDFSYGASFGVSAPEAYERLLLDAMRGDATLFTRADEIEQAWGVLKPILAAWSAEGEEAPPIYGYEAGSWGPESAESLLERKIGRGWRRL
jgi:glucose-6-phosphate 1-dehydrogenase